MTKQATCVICGKIFETGSPSAKYCCQSCKKEGYYIRRKKREARPGYKEHQKEIMARYQARQREALAAEKKATDKYQNIMNGTAEERAAAGSLSAALVIEMRGGPYSMEYWSTFQQYELSRPHTAITTVNGVPVTDPGFPEKAFFSILETGSIIVSGN